MTRGPKSRLEPPKDGGSEQAFLTQVSLTASCLSVWAFLCEPGSHYLFMSHASVLKAWQP